MIQKHFYLLEYVPTKIIKFSGRSTNDILLYNYTEIRGFHLARNMKLLYNEDLMLQEMLYDSITRNPTFPSDVFTGLPESAVSGTLFGLPPAAAQESELYTSAEVFESS